MKALESSFETALHTLLHDEGSATQSPYDAGDLKLEPTVAVVENVDFNYVEPDGQPIIIVAGFCEIVAYKWNPPDFNLLWIIDFDDESYEFSSPAVFTTQRLVVCKNDGRVLAFDVLTGDKDWEYNAGEKIVATAVSLFRQIYVVSKTRLNPF